MMHLIVCGLTCRLFGFFCFIWGFILGHLNDIDGFRNLDKSIYLILRFVLLSAFYIQICVQYLLLIMF
jgi:hypothetical protein